MSHEVSVARSRKSVSWFDGICVVRLLCIGWILCEAFLLIFIPVSVDVRWMMYVLSLVSIV